MSYPACPSTFDSRTPIGRIVHRVCLDEDKPTYRLVVTARSCRLCQTTETNRVKAASADDTNETPPPSDQNTATAATPPPETPGLVHRTLSYAEALIKWTAAGQPERSDKEVERLFHQHRKTCKWHDPERQICRGCGCRVADAGYAVLNKIKMATEHCPRDLW